MSTNINPSGVSKDELASYRLELLSALEAVIPQLTQIVARAPSNKWIQAAERGHHTSHYILVHIWLIEARQFALYLRRIVDEDTPRLLPFDDGAWMKQYYRPKEKPRIILQEFADLRRMELDWLRQLPSAAWSRTGRHTQWGVHTLQWFVEQQLEASQRHLDGLSRALNT